MNREKQTSRKQLLLLSTFGTHPEFDQIFSNYQYQVTKSKTLRKALASVKHTKPDVIVAEFVYAPTYGSQLSNFESLFAAAQTYTPEVMFIALVHKDDLQHFEKVASTIDNYQMDNYQMLTLPVKTQELAKCLEAITANTKRN